MLGCILVPFCGLGIPVLLFALQMARLLAQADIGLANLGVDESQKAYRAKENSLHADQTFRGWARSVGCSCQSYADFFFLWLCKMPIAWFGFFVTGLLLLGSGALIATPIVYLSCDTCMKNGNLCIGEASGDWEGGQCNGWRIATLQDAFGLCAMGVLGMILTLHISNGVAYLSRELTRCALATEKDGEGLNTSLLSAQHHLTGSQTIAQEYCQCDQQQISNRPILQTPIVIILDNSKKGKQDSAS